MNQFYSAYDKWTGDGKDPADFPLFKTEEIRKATAALRKPTQMAIDHVNATGGQSTAPDVVPPPPAGVDVDGWQKLLAAPRTKAGNPIPRDIFGAKVGVLAADPSPEMRAAFDGHFARYGYTADQVLNTLGIKPTQSSVADVSAPGAQEDSAPVSAAPEPTVTAPAAAPTPAPAPQPETPQNYPAGAYYGNEPPPTEADAEAYAKEKAAREQAAEARTRQNAEDLRTGRERLSSISDPEKRAQAAERLQKEHDTREAAHLAAQEQDVRDRIAALEGQKASGQRTSGAKQRYEAELKDLGERRKKLEGGK